MNVVRRYRDQDAAACCDIIDSAIDGLLGLNAAAFALLRSRNTPSILGPELARYHTIVYERDGVLLGVGALAGDELRRMYVRPEGQRRGIGRAILATLEQEARSRGLLELRTSAAPQAAGFYERNGFEAIGPREYVDGDARFQYVGMRKRLAALEQQSAGTNRT